MGKVRIVTDSTADIPPEIREALGIETVPLKIQMDGETFLDGVTIHPREFYERLARAAELPTTSQPSPIDFLEVYRKLSEEPGTDIISIHLSSSFSGTCQSAQMAKSLLEGKANISIMDSRSASFGFGAMAVAAAEAALQGASAEECVSIIENIRSKMSLYFLVDTLEYLQRGGRIGKAAALLGSMLNIKPILTIDEEASVAFVDKVRGQKRAMARIVELLQENSGGRAARLVVAHANAPQAADDLAGLLKTSFKAKDVLYTTIGPVIGTHVGQGTVAAFIYPE